MLSEAEKFASVDKEKRLNIDLKNQAETLCFEAEKELSLFKENISEGKQENIKELIKSIRQKIQENKIDSLNSLVEDLKTAMKDMVASKPLVDNDPMSNLNDF